MRETTGTELGDRLWRRAPGTDEVALDNLECYLKNNPNLDKQDLGSENLDSKKEIR